MVFFYDWFVFTFTTACDKTDQRAKRQQYCYFFHDFLPFIYMGAYRPRFYIGILTALTMYSINSAKDLTSWPSLPK